MSIPPWSREKVVLIYSFYFMIFMHGICCARVEIIFFNIDDYVQSKLSVCRAEFVFSVSCHEIC